MKYNLKKEPIPASKGERDECLPVAKADDGAVRELSEKIDKLLELTPTIEALGRVLIRRRTATKAAGLHRNTIDRNRKVRKFEEAGHRRTFIEIGDVAVIEQRKKKK